MKMQPVIIEKRKDEDFTYVKVLTEDNTLAWRAVSYYHVPIDIPYKTGDTMDGFVEWVNRFKVIDKNM